MFPIKVTQLIFNFDILDSILLIIFLHSRETMLIILLNFRFFLLIPFTIKGTISITELTIRLNKL